MKTYKQLTTQEPLNEITLSGIVIERKLKPAVNKIHATNDVAKKIDLLANAIYFSLGSMVLELHKRKQ